MPFSLTPLKDRNYTGSVDSAYRNILSFVARGTNSGKTTVMERIIAELASRGRKVAAVKHGLHMHYADKEGKDTQRFALNGAGRIVLFSPEGILMYENAPPTVDFLCCVAAAGMDVVLVEGFKSGPFRKIEVFNDTIYSSPLCTENPSSDYIALISNAPCDAGIPNFLFHEIAELCTFIEEKTGLTGDQVKTA
jgi:molybdopterin-guanine dinucleotide biosynthesis protein B